MTQTDRVTGFISDTAIKAPVRVATTSAIILAGEQTIDGIAMVTDDRVLVKNQGNPVDNGIYVVDTGAWSRASDFDGTYDVVVGTLVYVIAGAASAALFYSQRTTGLITIGTTALVFSAISLPNFAASSGSSLVGFSHANTYSQGTAGLALQAVVNVKNAPYNAVGNGSTDDAPAFQAAHDALPVYGGTILLPAPSDSYKLLSNIAITKRCRWVGTGKLATPIVCGASNGAFNATFTGGYLEFENLYVTGAAGTGTAGTAFNIVGTNDANHMTFVRMKNIYVLDFSTPFVFKYIDNIFVEDTFYFQSVSGRTTSPIITITFCAGSYFNRFQAGGTGAVYPVTGMKVGSNVDSLLFQNGSFAQCGGIVLNNVEAGATFPPRYCQFIRPAVELDRAVSEPNDTCFVVNACQDLRVTDPLFLAGYYGLWIAGGKLMSFSGGSAYLNGFYGIIVTGGTDVELRDIQVYDNSQTTDNAYAGILFSGARSHFTVQGCTLRSQVVTAGKNHKYHLSIDPNCSNFRVANNRFPDAAGTSVLNFGSGFTAYSIRNNQVRDGATSGTFTCAAATSTTINNKCIHAYSRVSILPTNAAAAALTGVYVSAKTAETSFVVAHSAASGTETFDYQID